jgi:hypothetical protein
VIVVLQLVIVVRLRRVVLLVRRIQIDLLLLDRRVIVVRLRRVVLLVRRIQIDLLLLDR